MALIPEKLRHCQISKKWFTWHVIPIIAENKSHAHHKSHLHTVTSCYSLYTVVGVNIKREMVLSPIDEEVANSSKKHTQFKTRVHKPYPISDQNGRNWYPISDQNS